MMLRRTLPLALLALLVGARPGAGQVLAFDEIGPVTRVVLQVDGSLRAALTRLEGVLHAWQARLTYGPPPGKERPDGEVNLLYNLYHPDVSSTIISAHIKPPDQMLVINCSNAVPGRGRAVCLALVQQYQTIQAPPPRP